MQKLRVRWAGWLVPGTAALALGLLAPPPAGAQAPVPVGGEFQVNTYTTFNQSAPSVAADVDGDFVVVWTGPGIQGQRYASNGSIQGAQFQVNTHTTSLQLYPSVAADVDGDFVVVWMSTGSFGTDTSGWSIQGQRYASDGSTQGTQFQVNTYTYHYQALPSVAVAPGGDFVVTWDSYRSSGTDTSLYSVQAQRYASNGSTQGAQFQVNTYTTYHQRNPSVAADADGDFVVAWISLGSFGTDAAFTCFYCGYSIQGQRYASDGSNQGSEFQVNSYALGHQLRPSVAVAPAGNFVVAWDSFGSFSTDHSSYSIQGQRFASDGSTQGTQLQVNTYTTNFQGIPSVTSAADGDFVVVWHSGGSSGTDTSSASIHGRRYASNGSTQGGQLQVNTYTTGGQGNPSAALAPSGNFVVAWVSSGSPGTDTSGDSIQGQRYSVPAAAVPAQVPAMSLTTRFALAAALLLLGATYALRRRA